MSGVIEPRPSRYRSERRLAELEQAANRALWFADSDFALELGVQFHETGLFPPPNLIIAQPQFGRTGNTGTR